MRTIKHALCALLTAALLLGAAMLTSAPAYAAEYQEGDYAVAFSMDGLGRHNVAWDTATVHVKDGKLYVDFTLERVDPRDHAPQYDWVQTDCGKFKPSVNEEKLTCSFLWVQVPNLGTVKISAQTSAMSQPYEVEYILHIDDSAIPPAPVSEPEPVAPSDPVSPPEPAEPTEPTEPAEPVDPVDPVEPDEPGSSDDPVEPATPDDTATIGEATTEPDTAPAPEPDANTDGVSVPVSPGTLEYDDNHLPLSGVGIAAIAAGAVAVIGCAIWLILRNKRK